MINKYCIVKNGKTNFHIVNHRYADETVRHAAGELQKYLYKATNTIVPYFSDCCPMRGPEIRLGANVRGETKTETKLCEDGFRIRAAGEHITITATTSRGVLYGVYRFLEIFCNYRCFTKSIETIDKLNTLEIELDEITEEPAFEYRDAYFRFAYDGDFAVKNRLNGSLCDLSVAKGGRMKWYDFHHSFFDLVSPEIYFDVHPEYFSQVDGERIKNGQLCLTNPEVLEISEKNLRGWISNNPECKIFSVAQNDNTERCTCEKCLAVEQEEGTPQGPILRFVNKLADRIKEDYPNVLLHTFAYQYSVPAPKKEIARDNVIVRLCTSSCRFHAPFEKLAAEDPTSESAVFVNALNDWQTHASRIYVWDYAVNFLNYLQPYIHLHTMAENIRLFRRKGIKGVLEQGNFSFGGGAAWDELKSYLIGKLLWNPYTDIDEEIERFLVGVYGKSAAPHLAEYLSLMEAACSSVELKIFQYPDVEFITDDLVEKSKVIFKKAINAADNEEFRKRIEREYLSIRFLDISRLDMNTEGRDALIEEFYEDLKSFGITEIRERIYLDLSIECMHKHRYVKDRSNEYCLYYVMQ